MRAGIVGTGLIGGSIGLGLTRAGWEVAGWDPVGDAAGIALERRAIQQLLHPAELLSWADIVVLAAPPVTVIELVAELETDALVIDVSGVKQPVAAASRLRRFVGTHPMAGREMAGPAAATPDLFRGAAWVVVPGTASSGDVDTTERLITDLGARPLRMSAVDHDIAVAVVSHLPQLLASTLMNEAADRTDALELVAGSFRDLTRVAASDPALWVQLLAANREAVLDVLADFLSRLQGLADGIAAGDLDEVAAHLERARRQRRRLAPQTVAVRVALADEPGELARVGHAFEASGVDVRDLQLRHAPHGGGGVLTVSVRSGDEEALRRAIEAEGMLLAE